MAFSGPVVSWGHAPHPAFNPTPGQFDGVEVGRVRRQIEQSATRFFHQSLNLPPVMEAGVIQHKDAAPPQKGQQSILQERLEGGSVPGAQLLPQRPHPVWVLRTGQRKGAQHTAVLAFGEGHFFKAAPATHHPAIQAMQSQAKAALVQKHQLLRRDSRNVGHKGGARHLFESAPIEWPCR